MRLKYGLLIGLLAMSGVIMAVMGIVIKFVILEPLGLQRQEPVIALPFVLLRDEGLRYVIADLRAGTTNRELLTIPTPDSAETAGTDATETILPERPILEQVLFIGDSRTCGLRDNARLDGADYFCEVGMSVFDVQKQRLSDQGFQGMLLSELLAQREYTCVYINLGLNGAGYPIDSLMRAYQELLIAVVRTQPLSTIVLQGVMTVSRTWAERVPYCAPENLRQINRRIQRFADNYRIYYIDPDQQFADNQGFLPKEMTADGCHLYAKYTHLWSDWICRVVEELDT